MRSEHFIVTALPVTAAVDATWHVTAFISPKLFSDEFGDDGQPPQLAEFPLFLDWAETTGRAVFTLWDQLGPMTTVTVPPEDGVVFDASTVWRAVFPPETPVLPNGVPDWRDRDRSTYEVASTVLAMKLLHLMTVISSPGEPPAPSAHPLGPAFEQLVASGEMNNERDTAIDAPPTAREFSERKLNNLLDRIDAGGDGLQIIERMMGAHDDASRAQAATAKAAAGLLATMRRAARYFEPTTATDTATAGPDRRTTPPHELTPPEGEFHARVSGAGDQPALLRALRLAVRLRGEPERLAAARWLAVEVAIDGDATHCRSPRSAVAHPGGDDLVVASAAGDTTLVGGAYALGEAPYGVIDLDPDGSALKQHNYLTGFVRTIAAETNGDDVNAATPALRATGLAVARSGRSDAAHDAVKAQLELETELATDKPVPQSPLLHAHQVSRGMRVEVWDDMTKKWYSLHRRLSTISVDGLPQPITHDFPNEGTLQGTAAHERPAADENGEPQARSDETSKIHIHETVFGWDGWSLSAPRPGKTISRRDEPDERTPTGWRQNEEMVANAGATDRRRPPHPFAFHHHAEPGSLPRLRYGRSYAFRAWAVDLAGETRPHELNPQPLPPAEVALALASKTAHRLFERQRAASSLGTGALSSVIQVATSEGAARRLRALAPQDPAAIDELPARAHAAVLRLGAANRSAATPSRATSGASLLEQVAKTTKPVDVSPLRDLSERTALIAAHVPALGRIASAAVEPAVTAAFRTVTPLLPFLRWDPVPPPALVPLSRYTEGESLRTVVVRTGVALDPATGEPVLSNGQDYLDDIEAAHPGFIDSHGLRAHGRRHVVPPKAAQASAELHGMLDGALADGPGLAEARARVLAWSLRENGSLFSERVVDLDDPFGSGLEQKGIALLHDPGADAASLKTLADLQPGPPPELGQAPAPGQYVVHDTDALRLPYLPDPLAAGLAITFVEAGLSRSIPFPHGSEGFSTAYPGTWPEKEPILLNLVSGSAREAELVGRTLTITLPPGERAKIRLSSSVDPERLDHLAVWSMTQSWFGNSSDRRDEALDGRLWELTPSDGVVLVNATPRPVARPVLIDDPEVVRFPGETVARLAATFTVHGPSTEHLTAEATWTDDIDEIADPEPTTVGGSLVAFTEPVSPTERVVPFDSLHGRDEVPRITVEVPEIGSVTTRMGKHTYPDTKHREVTYRLRAQTRYQEYFAAELRTPKSGATVPGTAAPGVDEAIDDGQSLVSKAFTVHVPNTTVPAAPKVHSVIPLFRWAKEAEPHQPAGRRHTRRAGVRIYLERPWYDTGSGELLAVLLAPDGGDAGQPDAPEWFSQWGNDPIWRGTPVEIRTIRQDDLDHLLRWQGDDERPPRPGRPVTDPVPLRLPGAGERQIVAVGYRPQFHQARRLWYVDVAFDADAAFWPFVRLSVARFQPHSVDGTHLSPHVRLDFVQLPPTRSLSVARTDERTVRVALSGSALSRSLQAPTVEASSKVHTAQPDRSVIVKLQHRADPSAGDLAWSTLVERELPPRGAGIVPPGLAWEGELTADVDIPFRTPLDDDEGASWRVFVEEWEQFPTDPATGDPNGHDYSWERRLVYADEAFL